MKQGALGEAGRARRILNLGRVAWLRLAQLAVGFASEQRVMIGQQDAMADGRDFVAHRVCDFVHRIAAETRHIIDRLGARLLQHIFELALLIGRVDRHQDDARKPAGQFEQNPLGQIVRVNRDARALGVPACKRPRQPLGIGEQLGVGPGPADPAVIIQFLERQPVGRPARLRRATSRRW